MFVRSRKATTYSRKRNGMSLIRNLRIVLSSNEGGAITDLLLILLSVVCPRLAPSEGFGEGAGGSQAFQRCFARWLTDPCSYHCHERDDHLRRSNLGLESR